MMVLQTIVLVLLVVFLLALIAAVVFVVLGAYGFLSETANSLLDMVDHNTDGQVRLTNLTNIHKQIGNGMTSQIFPETQTLQLSPEVQAHNLVGEILSQGGSEEEHQKKTRILLKFNGDVLATQVASLKEEVAAILSLGEKPDEVIVVLESPGGSATHYGYAASVLQQIKDAGIELTVCVDKIAASGGYLMACVADNLIASPWARVGSIGVVMDFPNYSKILQNLGVEYYEMTAGDSKRLWKSFSEMSEEDVARVQDDLDRLHDLFKEHVLKHRGFVDQEKVFDGDSWTAEESVALDLQLVDRLCTSDQYVMEGFQNGDDIWEIIYEKDELDLLDKVLHKAKAKGLSLLHSLKNPIL
jgi:ClpP class serine protease